MCGKIARHELHFDAAWEAEIFKCQICGTASKIRTEEEHAQPATQLLDPKTGRVDLETHPVPESQVKPIVAPEAIPSPAVINIVEVSVETAEPTKASHQVPTANHLGDVTEIRHDLREIKESHGRSYVVAVVLGLLAIGLPLFVVGATSSVRYWYLYEIAGIIICAAALAYLALPRRSPS